MTISKTCSLFFVVYTLILFSPLGIPSLIAQNQSKVDSLQAKLATNIETTARIDILNQLAWEFTTHNNEVAIKYGQEALNLALSSGYKKGTLYAKYRIASVYLNQDNYTQSLKYYQEIASYEDKIADYELIMRAHQGLANTYIGMSDLPNYSKHSYIALRIAEENRDTVHAQRQRKIIAHSSGDREKLYEILPIHLKDIEKYKNKGLDRELINEYTMIFNVFFRLDSLEQALKYGQLLKDQTLAVGDQFQLMAVYYQLARLHYRLNNTDKTYQYNQQALALGRKNGYQNLLTNALALQADLLIDNGQMKEARKVLNENISLALSLNNKIAISEAYNELVALDTLEKNYQKALEHYKLHVANRDSFYNLEVEKKIIWEQSQYEKEKALALERVVQKERNTRNIALVIILAILAVFIYDLIKNRIQKRKLTRLVKEQTKEIMQQNEKLAALDQLKTRLYTNITHELRTPLTVMLGMTTQLQAQEKTTTLATVSNKLNLIHRNGKNLLNLIKQILDLSKVENNQLSVHLTQDDLVGYVRYITESFHSFANALNILLTVESQVPKIIMDYDREKIRQICNNLLSNAIKYTSSGQKIIISLETTTIAATNESFVILCISDTGKGIPAEDLPYIFDRFYQANDTISKAGGTGIGLALTKELIQLLNGEIKVTSEINKGTTFTVKLPIHNNAPLETVTKAARSVSPSLTPAISEDGLYQNERTTDQPKLLIIEDNADVVEYLKSCLIADYQLSFAFNGRIGIEIALQEIPDIIISDVMMPDKDGLEVCDTLKNDERTSHIPIVLLTAKADIKSRIAGLRKGADAYLAKPFNPEELSVTLEQLVKLRTKLQERYAGLQLGTKGDTNENGQVPLPPSEQFLLEDAFVLKAKSIIEKNLNNATFSPQILAQQSGMSYSVMRRKFNALTGRSPSLFIRTIRLHHAKDMLISSDSTISEIAYRTGFNDPKFFSRVFSKEFGVSPSQYRANYH